MKVAVIGSGTAGLAATWLLNKHSDHQVHLFESDTRPGGHANTVEYTKAGGNGEKVKVDTGFIVFNTVTYPNFLSFLQHSHIPYLASDMSFSVTRDLGSFEWAGGSLSQLFAQSRNVFNPGHWRMVYDILRFNAMSLGVLREGDRGESIGDWLERNGYSDSFRDNYLLPMTAAIWSTPPDKASLDFPAFTLLTFMHNHHLLQILDRPTWLTLPQGSHSYVDHILSKLPPAQYHLDTPIEAVYTKEGHQVEIVAKDGKKYEFDHAVFATHADTTLNILRKGSGATEKEEEILGGFEFSRNKAVLHADKNLMPKRRSTWSAWNYLTSSDGPKANVNSVSLTYWMNLLQSIPEEKFGPVCVTLNPPFEVKKELVAGEWEYEHPLYTEKSVRCQGRLGEIQDKRGLTFCGAWTKYGFHEDGFASGLRLSQTYLSATPPFPLKSAERSFSPTTSSTLLSLFFAVFEPLRRFLALFFLPWFFLLEVAEGVLKEAEGLDLGKKADKWESTKGARKKVREGREWVRTMRGESSRRQAR